MNGTCLKTGDNQTIKKLKELPDGSIAINDGIVIHPNGNVEIGKDLEVDGEIHSSTPIGGGITCEDIDLGFIDDSTHTFDLVTEENKEKVFNIMANKKLIWVKLKVNNIFISGSANCVYDGSIYVLSLLQGTQNTFYCGGSSSLTLMFSIDEALTDFTIPNANYTLTLGYEN